MTVNEVGSVSRVSRTTKNARLLKLVENRDHRKIRRSPFFAAEDDNHYLQEFTNKLSILIYKKPRCYLKSHDVLHDEVFAIKKILMVLRTHAIRITFF